jgi:hypothetical protein
VTVPQSATATNIDPSTVTISIDINALISALVNYTGWDAEMVKTRLITQPSWNFGTDYNSNIERVYWAGWGDLWSDSGVPACFTQTGAGAAETVTFEMVYTPESQSVQNPSWDLVNVDNVIETLKTVTGYDSSKTQVLKNISGTITWVDE